MDFQRVLPVVVRHLRAEGHAFALVGGLALQAYGLSRATFDVDLVVALDTQSDLVSYLEGLGYETLHRSEGFSNHTHKDPAMGRIDLIYVDAVTSRRLLADPKTTLEIGGESLPVPRPEYLIAMKVHAMKNDPRRTFKEMADIQFLLGLEDIDLKEVREYFEKAGLSERFNELTKKA